MGRANHQVTIPVVVSNFIYMMNFRPNGEGAPQDSFRNENVSVALFVASIALDRDGSITAIG
jgi:hypothetical protein